MPISTVLKGNAPGAGCWSAGSGRGTAASFRLDVASKPDVLPSVSTTWLRSPSLTRSFAVTRIRTHGLAGIPKPFDHQGDCLLR